MDEDLSINQVSEDSDVLLNSSENDIITERLTQIETIRKQNMKHYTEISSAIQKRFNHFDLLVETVDLKNETEEYFKSLKDFKQKSLEIKNKNIANKIEEEKLKKRIEELELSINKTTCENRQLIEEIKQIKKSGTLKKYALKVAKEHYSNMFDVDLIVENLSKEKFTAVVTFNFAKQYPLSFVIDRENREVIDWSAESLLSSEQEINLKRSLIGTKYMPSILSYLRNAILSKQNIE